MNVQCIVSSAKANNWILLRKEILPLKGGQEWMKIPKSRIMISTKFNKIIILIL